MLMRASCQAAVCDDRRHICAEPKAASRNTAQFVTPGITPKFRMARRPIGTFFCALHSADIGSAFTAPEHPHNPKFAHIARQIRSRTSGSKEAWPTPDRKAALDRARPPFSSFNNFLRYELRREVLMMFRMYNRALSTAEVKQLYNAGR
jgi:hypothetical protein